jgi:alpha-L-arabinofuranosidase
MKSLYYIIGLCLCSFPAIQCQMTTQGETASVRIDLDDRRTVIPRGLSGIFMEEINHGFDGGIYAEMVQNRSFEEGIVPPGMKLVTDEEGNLRMELTSLPDGVPEERWPMPWPWSMNCGWDPARELVGWTLRNEGGSAGSMMLTPDNPMNGASQRSLRITIPKEKSGAATTSLVNSGYWGMNIQAGKTYDLTFFIRPSGFWGEIHAAIEGSDGKVLASAYMGDLKKSGTWKKFTARLTASANDAKAQLVISFKGTGDLQIDWVSLFPPTFMDEPQGLRPDLAQFLANLKPDFIRYPGGCYVQGLSWESAPDWRKMVVPQEERPGMWGYWKYRSTDGFGYHEFLKFCEQIGADAMYVAFAGMTVHPDNNWPLENLDTIIRQTLGAIEYAIGPAGSEWGSQRVKMGHPDPFPLKYVEIGNEHYAAVYGDYYVKFREAIKAKYPDITVIMSMYWSGLNRPAIERAGDENIDMVDEHAYRDAQWIRTNFDYFDKYKRTPWKVYVGEYASHHAEGDLLCALSDAAYLMMMENNGDLVKMASYAPLFCNVNDRSWGVNLIEYDASRSFAHTSYYVQQVFNENRPEVSLGTTLAAGRQPDTLKPLLGGRIGLGSWRTQTEFRDLEILDASGNTVFSGNFNNLDQWQSPVEGKWEASGGVLKQNDPDQDAARIFLNAVIPESGEIRVKARRTGGSEGFLVLFNGEKDDRFFFANYGAAGNSFHEVQSWGAPEGYAYKRYSSTRGAIENNRWYNLRIVIRRDRAEMYLDDQLLSSAGLIPLESMFASAGYDSQKDQVVVKVVNYDPAPVETRIELAGAASVGTTGRHILISSGDLNDRNTLENPTRVVPSEHQLTHCSKDFKVTVPGYSVNIFLIPVKK